MRPDFNVTAEGLALQLNWATALPILALVGLLLAVAIGYRRSIGQRGWATRLSERLNPWLEARNYPGLPPIAIALGAVFGLLWLALLSIALIGMVWVPVTLMLGDPLSNEDAGELRWYLITFTALAAALAALVALPFTVLRTAFNARQTRTAEQSHVTDQINKAVEALGAEKSVSRIGRPVTVTSENGEDTRIEWQGEDLPLAKGETVTERKDWRAFEETVPNTEVRIGAIYALERIAQDSLRDHVPIMEILTAYIRQNAPASTAEDYPEPELELLAEDASPEERKAHAAARNGRFGVFVPGDGKAARWARSLKADTITQAAIQVIARRNDTQIALERGDTRYGEDGYRLDLRETNLQAVDISGLNLSHALLNGARMEGAILSAARLNGADLTEARMEGVDLRKARMQGAELYSARMEGAFLIGARMEGAILSGARMEGAFLQGARMQGANLTHTRMEGAVLNEVQFDASTGFIPATLLGAGLKAIDFTVLDLRYGGKARLSGRLSQTLGDQSTDLPDGVARPRHWPAKRLDKIAFFSRWRAFQQSIGYAPPD